MFQTGFKKFFLEAVVFLSVGEKFHKGRALKREAVEGKIGESEHFGRLFKAP